MASVVAEATPGPEFFRDEIAADECFQCEADNPEYVNPNDPNDARCGKCVLGMSSFMRKAFLPIASIPMRPAPEPDPEDDFDEDEISEQRESSSAWVMLDEEGQPTELVVSHMVADAIAPHDFVTDVQNVFRSLVSLDDDRPEHVMHHVSVVRTLDPRTNEPNKLWFVEFTIYEMREATVVEVEEAEDVKNKILDSLLNDD